MEKKNGKKTFWQALLIISLVLLIAVVGYLAWHFYQGYLAEKEQQEVIEQVTVPETEEETVDGKDGEAAEIPDDIITKADNPINFDELTSINPDLYAWIQIPDTNINYPVAQKAGDDDFYLHHDMYGNDLFAGCIYTEEANAKDFSDPNTVLYGHNMKNKSMFQNLHLYESNDFFMANPYVYIYTADKVRTYEVFAAYTYDDRHLLNSFDFKDPAVFADYLANVQSGLSMDANLRSDITVTNEDRILTLSTCVGAGGSQRYLVQAVLIKEEESK